MVRLNQIQQQPVTSGTVETSNKINSGATASSVKTGAGLQSDATNFSAAAAIVAQATAGSDVRTEKVAALQEAISKGTYHVSSSDVADKLIDSLLGGQ